MKQSVELGILGASHDYHRLLDDIEPTRQSRNLDLFFSLCYRYYVNRGYRQIIMNHLLDLFKIAFFVFLTSILFVAIDYQTLKSISDKSSLSDIIHLEHLTDPGSFIVMYWVVFLGYFSYKILYRLYYDWRNLKKIKTYFEERLGIEEFELSSVSWNYIVSEIQKQDFQGEISAYFIANAIMRKDNYYIGMINDQIIDPKFCGIPVMTKLLEWYLRNIININLFGENRQAKTESNRSELADNVKWTAYIYGLLHIIFMPFIGFGVTMYFLFKYGEQLYNNPGYLFTRSWSPMAKWKFREFNELDHVFNERIHRSSAHTQDYLDQFNRMFATNFSNFMAFLVSSLLGILILFSFINEQVIMNLEITPGQTVLWWTGVLGTILATFRSFIKQTHIPKPHEHMQEMSKLIYYIPEPWLKDAHKYTVLQEIRGLFQFNGVLIMKEIFSVILIPFILFNLDSSKIVDYLITNTVEVNDLGKVFQLAQFDKEDQDLTQSTNLDKLAKSQIHFKNNFPEWSAQKESAMSDLMV